MNGGGIRDDATGAQFTKLDAYSMVPFANKVMKVSVTGAGIRQALEDGVARVATQGGGFPQVSGMTYTYSPANPVGSRVGAITVGGAPLDPARVYTAAVTNYVVNGGDGITGFRNGTVSCRRSRRRRTLRQSCNTPPRSARSTWAWTAASSWWVRR